MGVRQGCLLSPTLINIFLEQIIYDALEKHDGKVSIGSRNINLQFADDIDALAEEEQELEALVESLNKTCTRYYKMKISAEKTKVMTNRLNGMQREIKVKRQNLGMLTSFEYLREAVSDDRSKPQFSQGLHKPLQLFQS